MNSALFTTVHDDRREGGWIPQEAFVHLWHKKIKVMYIEDYQIEDLNNMVGKQFFITKQFSNTCKGELMSTIVENGEYVCRVKEVKHEYNDIQPSPSTTLVPAWLVYNCIQGR